MLLCPLVSFRISASRQWRSTPAWVVNWHAATMKRPGIEMSRQRLQWRSNRQLSTHRPATIYALSSAPGKAGVAVVRISGPNARQAATSMAKLPRPLEARKAYLRQIRDPLNRQPIDRGLVLWFPGPHSFTGEDIVEFHVHGGNAVVRSLLDALGSIENCRPAEQGEFAKRAFDNDKLDLTELEGLADLLNAETEAQRKLALRQAEGGLRVHYDRWRDAIIRCMSLTEAVIDFGEDEQIEDGVLEQVVQHVRALYNDIAVHLDDSRVGEIVRNGIRIAIVGPPNAGKSTLLNLLAKREAAIVSDIPGTTRDVVEVTLDLGGYSVIVSDTAGLRTSEDQIEMEGVRRAKSRVAEADITLCLLSLADGAAIDPMVKEVINKDTLVILNKSDVADEQIVDKVEKELETSMDMQRILQEKYNSSLSAPILITQARHRKHLQTCLDSLRRFLDMPADDVVLQAEELRHAANALGSITGRVNVEDVLDALFRQFCIGK